MKTFNKSKTHSFIIVEVQSDLTSDCEGNKVFASFYSMYANFRFNCESHVIYL